jgi:hypothetical protein
MAGEEWTPVLRGLAGGLHFPSMETRLWPDLPDKHRWALELMEKRLENTVQPARELSARAEELRAQAAQTDIDGYRDAALMLADRYEQAAASRLASA